MPRTTDRMLRRVKDVYLYISENEPVSTELLVEEFGVTRRTIQRDLNILQYNELVQSPLRGEWATTDIEVEIYS
ncbi:MAG TPA: HTH domain-containing protein [Savagea sp.]